MMALCFLERRCTAQLVLVTYCLLPAARSAFMTHHRARAASFIVPIHVDCRERQPAVLLSNSMTKYQELMAEKMPSDAVVNAVERQQQASGGGKVVAADVSAAAGVSLSQASKDLTALAYLSAGDIAVSRDGLLVYSFPPNLRAVLRNSSIKYAVLDKLRLAWPGIFWGIRVSFGVALLVSLMAIFTTILFIQTSSSSSDDDRRRDRGGGGGMPSLGGSYFWGPSPFDFLYWNRPYGYYSTAKSRNSDPEEMGLLPSIFSYVFGDGDPNANLEERRLASAANLIRQFNGAVTAEQLAPFCDNAPTPSDFAEATYVDEVSATTVQWGVQGTRTLTGLLSVAASVRTTLLHSHYSVLYSPL
jgi:hypothetical protein